ncbi:hypothetical protein [Pseudidiomarina sp.]|uniref:hypothetical protein n=1 Tax=Pseudidiomarina sp. TaxID=2081707 RepID=UPI003A978822
MHTTSLQEFQAHSHTLVSLTAEQAASEAHYWLETDQIANLQELVNNLQQQPFVASAQVQNRYGQNVVESTSLSDTDEVQQALTVVEEITNETQVIGYLTLTIDETLLLQEPVKTHAYLTFYGQFLLLFAIIAGVFIAITFNRWRYRRSAVPTK